MCQFLTCIASIVVAIFLNQHRVIDSGSMLIIISISVLKLSSMIDDVLELFELVAYDDTNQQ